MKRETHKSKPRLQLLAVAPLLILPTAGWGQAVTATIPVGTNPVAIAVNPTTNRIYVANCPRTASAPDINGTITVIAGESNTTTTVPVGICPGAIAVDSTTNKIYVANFGNLCLSVNCGGDNGSISVIDGATDSVVTIADPKARFPHAVALNSTTNKIYVANNWGNSGGNVTLIDGANNSITSIPAGSWPYDVAVNPVTNKIYVTSFNSGGATTTVTVIDGTTSVSTAVTDPDAADPFAVAVNPSTNKIYATNLGNLDQNGTNVGSITVIDGATSSTKNIADPNALGPNAVVVNPATNKIYVSNLNDTARSGHGGVTVIDGATNSFTSVTDPNASTACDSFGSANLAVEPTTDKVYVANCSSNNVTVIDGATNSTTTIADPNAVTPTAVAVNSLTHKTYVANAGSNNVTVIDATVIDASPDFSLLPASASLTVQPGGQVPDVITLAPQNGSFGNAIQLTCAITGPAPMPTCALSPSSVTPSADSVTSTLTITAPAAAAMQLRFGRPQLSKSLLAVGLALMFGITVVGGSKTKPRRYWLFCDLLLVGLVLQLACGGSNNSSGSGTPSSNYTVTVAGASGTIEHTAQVTVTVQ